jgi:hypothetical protein
MMRIQQLLFAGVLGLAACGYDGGPDGEVAREVPPGEVLVDSGFARWEWTPDAKHIVYATRLDRVYDRQETRLVIVDVETRVAMPLVPAATNGSHILDDYLAVGATFVYYELANASYTSKALYRTRIDGTGSPQRLLETTDMNVEIFPSTDDKEVAWVDLTLAAPYTAVVMDIASGARESFPLPYAADRLTWSPDGGALVAEWSGDSFKASTKYQWIDRSSRAVTTWSPMDVHSMFEVRADIGWLSGTPVVRAAEDDGLYLHSMATSERTLLLTLSYAGEHSGFTADGDRTVVMWHGCTSVKFQEGSLCESYQSVGELVDTKTRTRREFIRHNGSNSISGRISPDGKWFAYIYGCLYGCYSTLEPLMVVRTPALGAAP